MLDMTYVFGEAMKIQTLTQLSYELQRKSISAVELTKAYLSNIHKSELNAFISIDETAALEQAQRADEQIQRKTHTPLTGIPMAHKDIFCTNTMKTTCGSKMLANFYSPYAASLVEDLSEQGVVLLGKTNMDEFAMGSTNETSYFGPVKNPWDLSRVAGGSSGGSAAAVAASLCVFATGSDTGGSVRQPSAFCGISGLKPTYGLISRYGMVAYASSLDTAGIMARSAEDIALILRATARFDSKDSTSANVTIPDYCQKINDDTQSFRVGIPRGYFDVSMDSEIQQSTLNALRVFEQLGAQVIELDLALQPQWVPCYYVIACAEASSNLSRYDGIRYGHRSSKASTLRELITHSREEGFGMEVKRRILTGTHVLSAGFYEDYYIQALKVRRLIRDELCQALSQVDVIIGPTTPTCATKVGEKNVDPTQLYLADIFTVGANLAGLPAISIPSGFNPNGLPIGIQLLGKHFDESRILQLAHQFQQTTQWHLMTPQPIEKKI